MPEPRDARAAALAILRRVESKGAFASMLLQRLGPPLPPEEIRLATELVYGSLRFRFHDEHVLSALSGRDLREIEPDVVRIFRLAAHQILRLDRIPDRAAVNEAVSMARSLGGGGEEGGRREARARFVNALLRRLCREKGSLPLPRVPEEGAPPRDLAEALRVRHSHPAWIIRRWIRRYGREGSESLLRANNRPAPVAVRVEGTGLGMDEARAALEREGVIAEPSPVAAGFLRVARGAVQRTRLFAEAGLYIQDEASGLVSGLLAPAPGTRVLDCCAAPGGKAIALARAVGPGGRVVAADRHLARLRLVRANRDRAGLANLLLVAADMTVPPMAGPFDAILVDAPCSGSGVFRRDPEARYRLSPEDLPALARRQRSLLEGAAGLLSPGGRLLYAVCSIEPEEGPELIEGFLADHPEFRRHDLTGVMPDRADLFDELGCFRTLTHVHDMDGFFAAALSRR